MPLVGVALLAAYSVFRFREAMLTFYFRDDFWVMRDGNSVQLHSLWDLRKFLWFGQQGFRLYRPLTTTAYSYVLQSLFGFDASGQHGFQLLAFTLNVVLVVAVVRRITDSALAGLAAGLLYLLAPGQAVNAYWLSAFTVTGTTIWILLMLWCWLVLHGWARILVCTLLQICGLLASEHAITAPVLCGILSLLRHEPPRPSVTALLPSVVLVGVYAVAKLLYLHTAPALMGTYTVNLVPVAMIQQLGQYLGACVNLLALQQVSAMTNSAIGIALLMAGGLSLWSAWRGNEAARLIAAGVAIFVVSLIPVLVLRGHFYDHYICTAAFGAVLAVLGCCRAAGRHWQRIAAACAVTLLIVDLFTSERAWRQNATFRLIVNGSLGGAAWVQEIQRVNAEQNEPYEVYVSINPATDNIFAHGQAERFLPGIPPHVTRFNLERVFTPAPPQITIKSAPPIYFGQPLPLWDPRWDALRRFAWWPRHGPSEAGPGKYSPVMVPRAQSPTRRF